MKKLATLALLCTAIGGFPALAQDHSPAGYYCESAEYEIVDQSVTCEKPDYTDPDTGKCISKFVGTDYLDITPKDNGDIDFSLFLVYEGGHSCGLENETAKKIDENTWLFEKQLVPDSVAPSDNCSVKISYSKDGIEITSPNENATCKSVCGMRGSLKDVIFPTATKDDPDNTNGKECSHPVLDLDQVHLITK